MWISAGKGEGESHSGIWSYIGFSLIESSFGCFRSGIGKGADLQSFTEAPAAGRDTESQRT